MNHEQQQSEITRLNAVIARKNNLIQQQSDKVKELETELDHFIKSSTKAMKLVDDLKLQAKMFKFIDKRMKGNDLYDTVIGEIMASHGE